MLVLCYAPEAPRIIPGSIYSSRSLTDDVDDSKHETGVGGHC